MLGFLCFKQDPSVRRITWNGSGPTVTKVISCAEITKRRIKVSFALPFLTFFSFLNYIEAVQESGFLSFE